MNKWNQLLKVLDTVFGFESNKNSSVKKLKQHYDEKRDEHVFVVEYRVVKIDPSAQAGVYTIAVGLYNRVDSERIGDTFTFSVGIPE